MKRASSKQRVLTIPTKKRRRYFRKVYERYDVYDVAKIPPPAGAIGIYDAIQKLAAKHGGDDWDNNPFSKYWHFRQERVILNGETRSRVMQSFILEDDLSYEENWGMRCQPDVSPRTIAIRAAAKVFKTARRDLLKGLSESTLRFKGRAKYKDYSLADFVDGIIADDWCRIVETGTLPPEALKDRATYDRETEGELIYLYITESSLKGWLAMSDASERRTAIDAELGHWLISHTAALYDRINHKHPHIEPDKRTYPCTVELCYQFSSLLSALKGVHFAQSTYRDSVWNTAEAKRTLPRGGGQKIGRDGEKRKALEALFTKYVGLLAPDLDQSPRAIVERLFDPTS